MLRFLIAQIGPMAVLARQRPWVVPTAVCHTKILHADGFDSNNILVSRGEIPQHAGTSEESRPEGS